MQEKNFENSRLLYEFYARANVDSSQNKVTKNMEIWIYSDDRDQMTPHCHIFDKSEGKHIEVSLLDWSIINVKTPKNLKNEWSEFSTFQKNFLNG